MGRKSRRKRKQSPQTWRTTEVRKAPQGVLPFEQPPNQQISPFTAEFHAGPYPHPDLMGRYDEIVPGMAQDMVKGYNEQRHHRMALERMTIVNNIIQSYIGQATAFIVTMFGLYLAYLLVSAGNDIFGFGLAVISLAALAGTFYIGKREQAKELSRKAQDSKELEKRG